MDQELKAYLDGKFGEIDRKFARIDERFAQIDERFAQIDRQFKEVYERIDAVQASMFRRLDEVAATLEEHFRDQQTEMLKAAFTLQEQIGIRLRENDGAMTAVKERMTVMERRLFEIEKRLLMPPQPQ